MGYVPVFYSWFVYEVIRTGSRYEAQVLEYQPHENPQLKCRIGVAGIQQSAVARLENGGTIPRLDTLYKVVCALGMEFKLAAAGEEQAAAVI